MAEEKTTIEKPKIDIEKREVGEDPILHVYYVTIAKESEEWRDGWASEAELRAYLRGIQAGAQMFGNTFAEIPEIPR